MTALYLGCFSFNHSSLKLELPTHGDTVNTGLEAEKELLDFSRAKIPAFSLP
jgi:hypothetical protein